MIMIMLMLVVVEVGMMITKSELQIQETGVNKTRGKTSERREHKNTHTGP